MRKLTYIIFLVSFLILNSTINLFAETFSSLKIDGNKRITNETILNLINFSKDKNYSLNDLNSYQKKLFETGFFKNVNISSKNNILYIKVVENPLIDFFYIDGVKSDKRRDFLFDNLSLGSNKIFSEQSLKNDINFIKKIFLDSGFLNIKVDPTISVLENGNINLIYKIDRGNQYTINRIFFIGDKKFKSSNLLDVIKSSESGWWKFLSDSDYFNEKRLEYDKFLLKEYYLNNGFYDVQISSVTADIIEGNKVNLAFSIDSGIKYSFLNYKIKDELKILNKKTINEINKVLLKKAKGFYSLKTVRSIKKDIYNILNLNRIEFANFNINENKNSLNQIDLDFIFFSESRKFVNNISVVGNSITEEKVIRDKLLLIEGDPFLTYKLNDSIKNLNNLGIFSSVKDQIKNNNNDKIDIEIKVEEKPTGSIGAGIGIGSSMTAISTQLQEKNLFGKGITSNLNASIGTESISGNVYLSLPDFNNTGNTFNYSLYTIKTDYTNTGYESSKIGNDISITYDLYEDLSLKPGFGFDYDKIDVGSSASSSLQNRDGNYTSLKTFYDLTYDKRNNSYQPSSGYKIKFSQTLAAPGASDIPFLKNKIDTSYYYPLHDEFTFIFKNGISSINSLNDKDVKLSDRLNISTRNLRGFGSRGIGPTDNNDHIGGNYAFYSSLATTFPNGLPDKWNAKSIVFFDTGNVWGVDYNKGLDNTDEIRSSLGTSLDWLSPLGPLNFTLAKKLSGGIEDKTESFSFQIGSIF